MSEQKEQISKELFLEMLDELFYNHDQDFYLGAAKQKGFIKQTEEESIREKLDNLYKIYYDNQYKKQFPRDIQDYIITMTNIKNCQKDLIEILDNKIKTIKGE